MSKSKPAKGIPISFEQFLKEGTVGAAIVEFSMDPEVIGEINRVADKLEALYKRQKKHNRAVDDESLSGSTPTPLDEEIARLEAKGEKLHKRYEESLTKFTIAAIDQATFDDVVERFPTPEAPLPPRLPQPPADDASKGAKKRYQRQLRALQPLMARFEDSVKAWRRETKQIERERRFEILAHAIVKVERGDEEVEKPSADALRALYSRPHGSERLERLWAGLNEALADEMEVDRPTSPAS